MAEPNPPPPGAVARPRVLIIEDYKAARESLGKQFWREGYESATVADALEAYPHIHSSARDIFDAYLIDLRLPGQSGAQIIRIIRLAGLRSPRTGRPVWVVAYTCLDASDPSLAEAIAAGADAVVFKLTSFEEILAVVTGRSPGNVPIDDPA